MIKAQDSYSSLKQVFTLSIILMIIMSNTALLVPNYLASKNKGVAQFYVGVTFCGNTTVEAKLLINRVKTYTNLLVLQSGPISKNETATNEICDYAVASGLHVIVFFGWFDPDCPWQIPWLDFAKQRWGDRFLGIYYYDEPGGIQVDYDWFHLFDRMKQRNSTLYQVHATAIEGLSNGSLRLYDEAAEIYVNAFETASGLKALKNRSITAFTSDYALYWFDYMGGYDVVLAQIGWNHSLTQDIALIRGAARMLNKTWGAMISWKYRGPPYLDNGEEIYGQMRMAYESGAKYIMIFNYPKINEYGILTDEHFEALERFWNEVVKQAHVVQGAIEAEAALILPRSYGWEMRSSQDRIWGFWGPDEKSPQIWKLSRSLLTKYGLRLDILYNDTELLIPGEYRQIYYWNYSI